MTDRDALIEEAAKAICKAHVEESTYGDFAAAALAVFEKAHTPTTPTGVETPQYLDAELCGHDYPPEGDEIHVAGDPVDMICLASPIGHAD